MRMSRRMALYSVSKIKALNDCSWEEISQISSSGEASNYWSIGDCKGIYINGTIGSLSISGTYYVYIIGFDHNSSLEGTGITFGTFKTALTNGISVCLVDNYYGQHSSETGKYFNINHSASTNLGGWRSCDLRYDILGSTNQIATDATSTTATTPVRNTFMETLPADLRAVMKPMTVYTDNYGVQEHTEARVSATVDYLPLLAEYEVFGKNYYANSYEPNYQQQYQYYSVGNSKVKCRHSATDTTAYYWGRSNPNNTSTYFCAITPNGIYGEIPVSNSYGIAPIFRV